MDKLIRKIIVAVVIVLLGLTAYLSMEFLPDMLKQREIEQIEQETEKVEVLSLELDNLQSIFLENVKGSYTFVCGEDGVWTIEEYDHLNLEKLNVANAVVEFINVKARKEVDAPEKLADYGLETPRAKYTIKTKDGEELVFALGNEVKGDVGYFLHDVKKDKYYTTNAMTELMEKEVNDYRQVNLLTLTEPDLVSLSITNSSGKIVMTKAMSKYTEELVWAMSQPREMDLDVNAATAIIESVSGVSVVDYIEDSPKDLSIYGLSKPALTIGFDTVYGKETVRYGDKANDGNVFAMMEGYDFVFTVNAVLFEQCVDVKPYDLMSKFVNLVYLDDVTKIIVSDKKDSHELEIKSDDKYYVNGKKADADEFSEAYQSIIAIKVSGLADKSVSGNADYTVEFEYENGEVSVQKFIPYDELNYLVDLNGEKVFITPKKGLKDMMDAVNDIAS